MVTNAKTRPTCCCCRCRKMLLLLFNSLIGYYTSFLFQHFNGVGFYITNDLSSCIYCCSSLFYLDTRIFNRLICAVEIKMARVRVTGLRRVSPSDMNDPNLGIEQPSPHLFFLLLLWPSKVKYHVTIVQAITFRYYNPDDAD